MLEDEGMVVTFGFNEDRKQELQNFVDPTHSHRKQYIALLQELGVTQQCWKYYTPKQSAPPGSGPKLAIWFLPDDASIWSAFITKAKPLTASTVVQDACRTLPVGTSTGPHFHCQPPDESTYDCEILFTYPD